MSTAKTEFLTGHTESKETYIKTWSTYIEELIHIGYPLMRAGDGLFDELTAIQDRLDELVKIAADQDFDDNRTSFEKALDFERDNKDE